MSISLPGLHAPIPFAAHHTNPNAVRRPRRLSESPRLLSRHRNVQRQRGAVCTACCCAGMAEFRFRTGCPMPSDSLYPAPKVQRRIRMHPKGAGHSMHIVIETESPVQRRMYAAVPPQKTRRKRRRMPLPAACAAVIRRREPRTAPILLLNPHAPIRGPAAA